MLTYLKSFNLVLKPSKVPHTLFLTKITERFRTVESVIRHDYRLAKKVQLLYFIINGELLIVDINMAYGQIYFEFLYECILFPPKISNCYWCLYFSPRYHATIRETAVTRDKSKKSF